VEVVEGAAVALGGAEGVAPVVWVGPMLPVPVATVSAQAADTAKRTSRVCHATNKNVRSVAPSWPANADRRMPVPEPVGIRPVDPAIVHRQLEAG
jgi:hypothetical protein